MAGLAVFVVVLIVASAVVLPLLATSTPGFFSRYHLLNRRFVNLEGSAHEGIGCRTCHETQPVQNGVALVGDFYRSLVTSEPLPAYFKFSPPNPRRACSATRTTGRTRPPRPSASRTRRTRASRRRRASASGATSGRRTSRRTWTSTRRCRSRACASRTAATSAPSRPTSASTATTCCSRRPRSGRQSTRRSSRPPETPRASSRATRSSSARQCHTTGKVPEFTGLTLELGMKAIEELHVKPEWTPRYHGAEALKDQPSACSATSPRASATSATASARRSTVHRHVDRPPRQAGEERGRPALSRVSREGVLRGVPRPVQGDGVGVHTPHQVGRDRTPAHRGRPVGASGLLGAAARLLPALSGARPAHGPLGHLDAREDLVRGVSRRTRSGRIRDLRGALDPRLLLAAAQRAD